MHATPSVKKSGLVTAAGLTCFIKEENAARKESFTVEWQDHTLSTRPEQRCKLNEVNDTHKESFSRQHQTQFVVQRSASNVMKMGRLGEGMTKYSLPYQNRLPLPIFKPADLSSKLERALTPPELQRLIEFERFLCSDGSCQDKCEIAQIKSQLPPIMQPSKLLRSFSRSLSQEAQRG
ncbi:telethonin-like [Protopterus annectens]|uniref:telethonin-like n=1 Tax=Protopterus annectens TaxID=7888 RepID=UPI001CFB8885|nr:telethonin-like [Protopterus annectens]